MLVSAINHVVQIISYVAIFTIFKTVSLFKKRLPEKCDPHFQLKSKCTIIDKNDIVCEVSRISNPIH